MITSEMQVDFIDKMGTDLTVVNSARVSFAKESDWVEKVRYVADQDGPGSCTPEGSYLDLKDNDKGLVKFLATHDHWTPFGHAALSFRVKAPLFVARQLGKHQVGLVWNEESRRYIDSEPEFWFPKEWRARHENKKQGSKDDEFIDLNDTEIFRDAQYISYNDHYDPEEMDYAYFPKDAVQLILNTYNGLLEANVAPELARIVLPQNMMVNWYWSGTFMAFARVCNLRLKPDAQAESREVAKLIFGHMKEHFPNATHYMVKYAA